MSNVFTDDSYMSLGLGIIFLYLLIGIWIYLFEDIRPKFQDIVYFIGNLVNQPFPKNAIKVKRISSYILLRTFDIFTFAFTLMYCSTMIYKVLSTEQVGKLIDSLDQLQHMKNKQIYITRNSFVQDFIDDIKSLKMMRSAGSVILDTFSNFNLKKAKLNETHCKYDSKDFRKSSETVAHSSLVWLLNKKSPFQEIINQNLLWMLATGLKSKYYNNHEGT